MPFVLKMYKKRMSDELWPEPTRGTFETLDLAKDVADRFVSKCSWDEERAAYIFDGPNTVYSKRR